MNTELEGITGHPVFNRPELVAPEELELTRNQELLALNARIQASHEKQDEIDEKFDSIESEIENLRSIMAELKKSLKRGSNE